MGTAAAGVWALSAAAGCYGSTELVLAITTDHACVAEGPDGGPGDAGNVVTAIKIGGIGEGDDPVTEIAQCTTRPQKAADIGTLVIVPSGSRDARVCIKVMMTTNAAPTKECAGATVPAHCIVARRSATFIEHASLRIPVHLYDACRGVTCDGETTCGKAGTCVSAIVGSDGCTAADTDCKTGKEPPASGGVDAAAPDASVPDVDTGPTVCAGPNANNILQVVPLFPVQGGGSTDPTLLASNSTHLFWTEPGTDSKAVLKRMAKSGAGAPEDLGSLARPVLALAASDTHWWAASPGEVLQGRLDGGATTQLTQARGDIVAIGIDAVAPAFPYFTTTSVVPEGSVFTVRSDLSMEVLEKSEGGAFIAVTSSAVFTASTMNLRRHPLPWVPPNLDDLTGAGRVNGLAAHGAVAYVSEPDRGRVATYGGGTPESVALLAAPAAIALDGTTFFVLDQASAPGGQSERVGASVRRGAMAGRNVVIPRITPLFANVTGLVIDQAPSGCVYFMGAKAGVNSLHIHPKQGPPL